MGVKTANVSRWCGINMFLHSGVSLWVRSGKEVLAARRMETVHKIASHKQFRGLSYVLRGGVEGYKASAIECLLWECGNAAT